MHGNRGGGPTDGPVVERLLTRQQAVHARTVLGHVQDHAPHPEAEVHLAVLLLTLRAARAGTGTSPDRTSPPGCRVMPSERWNNWSPPTGCACPVPSPRCWPPGREPHRGHRPHTAARTAPPVRLRQDHPLEDLRSGPESRGRPEGPQEETGAATRLLALYSAAHTRPDGRLGHAEDGGLHLDRAAAFCALPPEEITGHVELLIAADWLAEADTTGGRLRGQLTERVLPLGGLL
ncbi:hypothetical protein ACR6C2_03965 [Streptomyces sp. INA 01156]